MIKKFKIDLIVWKQNSSQASIASESLTFKIDLIVWKSLYIYIDKAILRQFKIDLIVWKFFTCPAVVFEP